MNLFVYFFLRKPSTRNVSVEQNKATVYLRICSDSAFYVNLHSSTKQNTNRGKTSFKFFKTHCTRTNEIPRNTEQKIVN